MDRIEGPTTVDIGGGRRGFRSKDTVAGVPGTELRAKFLNALQEEVVGFVEATGQVPDYTKLNQLLIGIRGQHLNYVVAGGTANALTFVLDPAPASLAELFAVPLRIKTVARSTGPLTIAPNGLPPTPVVHMDGSATAQNDALVGSILTVAHDGAAFRLLGIAYSEIPRTLTGPLTLYIRPDGNDANDGSADTGAAAFLTISGALNAAVRKYASSQYQITLKVADGLYQEWVNFSRLVGRPFKILGNSASPQNVIIRSPVNGRAAIFVENGADVEIDGVQVEAAAGATGVHGIAALNRSRINYRNIRFGSNLRFQVAAVEGSIVSQDGPVNVTAGAAVHIAAVNFGVVNVNAQTITYTGTPAFSIANVWSNNGTVLISAVAFAGAVTGQRFLVNQVGLVFTNGGGVNVIPGTVAGVAQPGSLFE